MFSISNKISYDNLMVQGKKETRGLGEWFDVGGGAKDKFVPEQADYLKEELHIYRFSVFPLCKTDFI